MRGVVRDAEEEVRCLSLGLPRCSFEFEDCLCIVALVCAGTLMTVDELGTGTQRVAREVDVEACAWGSAVRRRDGGGGACGVVL